MFVLKICRKVEGLFFDNLQKYINKLLLGVRAIYYQLVIDEKCGKLRSRLKMIL